jgi:hypothetical protein
MGCWCATDFVTKLPILAGDKVAMFIERKSDFAHSYHCPEMFPLIGIYNDYGGIEEVEDTFSFRFLKDRYGRDTFLRELEPDYQVMTDIQVWHELSVFTEQEREDFMLSFKQKSSFDFAFHAGFNLKEWCALEGSDEEKAAALKLYVPFRTEEERKQHEERKYRAKLAHFSEHFGDWDDTARALWKYPWQSYIEDYIRFVKFYHVCFRIRRPIFNDNTGSQHWGFYEHRRVLKLASDILEKKIAVFENDPDWPPGSLVGV